MWTTIGRPGYFGRKRDERIAEFNAKYGVGHWRLVWIADPADGGFEFAEACKRFYEVSYLRYLSDRPDDVAFLCSFGECIDNAPSNVHSGCDYTRQESYSTHIQDIAVRNVLSILGKRFMGPPEKILVIRSKDSNGFRFGPGNIPFYAPNLITQPSRCPTWARVGSVEDFWQSAKHLQARTNQVELL